MGWKIWYGMWKRTFWFPISFSKESVFCLSIDRQIFKQYFTRLRKNRWVCAGFFPTFYLLGKGNVITIVCKNKGSQVRQTCPVVLVAFALFIGCCWMFWDGKRMSDVPLPSNISSNICEAGWFEICLLHS